MYKKFFKRLIDIVGALFLIILTSPIMLILAIIVKIDRGQVLYKQQRSGKDGVFFTFYKFGSCVLENNATDFSGEDDRYTKTGAFLRKTSLDEIPQLFLILSGKMSFIGPRPWMIEYCEFFTNEQKKRLSVRPGITGLAQCSGRNDLTIIEKINNDIEYIENITFVNDVKIIFKTIKSVFIKEGANSTKLAVKGELDQLKEQFELQTN